MQRNFLFLLLLSSCGLAAGEKSQPRVRFLAESATTPVVQVVVTAGEKRSVDFDLAVNYLSKPIETPGRSFQLRGKQPDEVIANIQLPETGNDFVSLLVPSKNGDYKAIVIPTDEDGFQAGAYYLYNHSDQTVTGSIGTSKFVITPGKGQILKPEGAGDNPFYDVVFAVRQITNNREFSPIDSNRKYNRSFLDYINILKFVASAGKGPILPPERTDGQMPQDVASGVNGHIIDQVFSSTRWPVDNRMRSYIFFFGDLASGQMNYRAVDEFVPPTNP
jgi:hypothetical protein